jgi:D-beta-D-heptose 7-phosphate kinase/D-beta-D-heptose 1-phosphate adenosyltransferase
MAKSQDGIEFAQLLVRFDDLRLTVIGDVILDHYIWGDVGRISPEAPVPLVDVSHENHRLGGAANVALNVSTLGTQASLFGRIGADAGGTQLKQLLREADVQWLGDSVPPARDTILKTRVVARHQQLCRLDREGRRADYALEAKDWDKLLEILLSGADGILLSDYAKGVIDNNLLSPLREQAKARNIPVFCDPKPKFGRDFSGLELLTPNRGEAIAMSGIDWDAKDPFPSEAVVKVIQDRYNPRYLVITLGAEGMLFAERGQIGGIVPTLAREVFDVSGAGDTVIAVLSLALLAGASLEEAVTVANTAAGVVVGKLGTATVSRDEILAYARDHAPATE